MNKAKRTMTAAAISAAFLAGCYVVPVTDPQGNVQYAAYPLPPAGVPVAASAPGAAHASGSAGAPMPVSMNARLYPANELANQTGMISGTVTNMRTGKGRFQLQYQNEVLIGEATRHGPDGKRGVASAYGSGGTFMQCEYEMNTPVQGAGSCTFSNGARYKVHIGS